MLTGGGPVVVAAGGLRIAGRKSGVDVAHRDLELQAVCPVTIPTSAPSEARTEDGFVWRRVWLAPDRLVADFPGHALVEVRDSDGAVTVDRELAADLEEHLVLDHVLPLVLARRGELVLHGAVVSRDGHAAVLTGPTGSGKSTLTAWVGHHGWDVGGDDGAVIHFTSPLAVEPTYPTVRLLPDATALLGMPSGAGTEAAGKRRLGELASRAFRTTPTELALVAVVNAVEADQPSRLTRLGGVAAHAALFGNTFHAELARGPLLTGVVDRLADVATAVPVVVLDVPRGRDGLAAAEAVLSQAVGLCRDVAVADG